MCKYKHSLTKIETSYIVAFFERYELPICRVQILKIWTMYFYSCPAFGNSLSVAERFMIFVIESKH